MPMWKSGFAIILLILAAASPAAATTALFVQSQPGSVGGGVTERLVSPRASFSVSASRESIVVTVTSNGPTWYLSFAPPAGQQFKDGIYEGAERTGFTDANAPGMNVSTDTGCNSLSGRYELFNFRADVHGTILSFALQFEQHCEDQGYGPALFGQLLFEATGGAKPRLSVAGVQVLKGNAGTSDGRVTLSLSRPLQAPVTVSYATSNGTGVAGTDYVATQGAVTFPAGVTSEVVAIPVIGNRIARGAPTFNVVLSDPVGVALGYGTAQVDILDPNGPLTALLMTSQPGDFVGQADAWVVPAGGPQEYAGYLTGGVARIGVAEAGGWGLDFAAPTGSSLAPGTYLNAQRYTQGQGALPGMFVTGQNRSCNALSGWFTINAITSNMHTFSVDFEQTCQGASGSLFGSLRANSILPQLSVTNATIAGNVATFQITVNPISANAVNGGFGTIDGSAIAGTNYTTVDTFFSIPAGQGSTTVNVPLIGTPQPGLFFYGYILSPGLPPAWNWYGLARL
jgi:hypothetical protein